MYQTVLFDLDGTLTNPELGITTCVAYALEKFGIQVQDRKLLRPFIGPPLIPAFQKFYGLPEADAKQALAYYRERFSVKGLYENEVYDGVENLLRELKAQGKTVVLATSKPETFASEILKHFHLYAYFDFIAGATMDGSRGEKGDVIAYALQSGHVAGKAVMVGDRNYDIIGAKENGLDSIGVLYGFGGREELTDAGATYLAETVEDILRYV